MSDESDAGPSHGGPGGHRTPSPRLDALTRYLASDEDSRAILTAAADAHRVGAPPALPAEFLVRAARGYPHLPGPAAIERLQRALSDMTATTDAPLLTLLSPAEPGTDWLVRLATPLHDLLLESRRYTQPPDTLWEAAIPGFTDPDTLLRIANGARSRGRYHHARQLYQRAADAGAIPALRALAWLAEQSGDQGQAEDYARQAVHAGDMTAIPSLITWREQSGDQDGAERLAHQAADAGDLSHLQLDADVERSLNRSMTMAVADSAASTAGHDPIGPRAVAWWGEADQYADRTQNPTHAGLEPHERLRKAIAAGHTTALYDLARLLDDDGDPSAADRIRRFGITADGEPAEPLTR